MSNLADEKHGVEVVIGKEDLARRVRRACLSISKASVEHSLEHWRSEGHDMGRDQNVSRLSFLAQCEDDVATSRNGDVDSHGGGGTVSLRF